MRKILAYAGVLILSIFIVFISSYSLYMSFVNKPVQEEKAAAEVKNENVVDKDLDVPEGEEYYDDEALNIPGVKINLAFKDNVYQLMHEMANTKVVADKVYATLEVTPDRVNALIKAVNRSNWSDKSRLLEILNRWKVGDFSQGVEDHNYVWEKLGGEAGKATSLKK